MTDLAVNVRTIRETLGWSQGRLAELTGLTQSVVSRLETGDRSISVDDLLRVAAAFQVEPCVLLRPLGRIVVLSSRE